MRTGETKPHRALPWLAGVLGAGFLALSAAPSSAQDAWETDTGRACIDEWIDYAASTLNAYNGDTEFNGRKPWRINQYGLFAAGGIFSNFEPDNWAQYGADKHRWMWGFYTDEQQFPDWSNPNFNGAGLQGLRWYVGDCLADGGGLPGPAVSVPPSGPPVGSIVALDTNAVCPATFGAHVDSTLTIICYCAPDAMTGTVWGTGTYTHDSPLCAAALHAGAVGPGGGMIVVKGAPGQDSYQGTESNGVVSADYPAFNWSYVFPNVDVPAELLTDADAKACPGNMMELRGTSAPLTCHCAPDTFGGAVWGSGIYTDDSSLCTAALHAGVVGLAGGVITAVPAAGQGSYDASVQNGVSSDSYGSWDGSFYFP